MTETEAAEQRAEIDSLLGVLEMDGAGPAEIIGRMAVQQISEEYVSVLSKYGYEITIGLLDSGNIAVGLLHKDAASQGPGYVLAEFSADNLRELLR